MYIVFPRTNIYNHVLQLNSHEICEFTNSQNYILNFSWSEPWLHRLAVSHDVAVLIGLACVLGLKMYRLFHHHKHKQHAALKTVVYYHNHLQLFI